jgi:hypothetical protein
MHTHRVIPHRLAALAFATAIIIFALAATDAVATTRYVAPWGSDLNPGTALLPMARVQTAINALGDGDTVLLADGVYSGTGNRDIDLHGKAIRVASSSGQPQSCIIDCTHDGVTLHYGFIFSGFYSAPAGLSGLTVMGARTSGDTAGALMLPDGASEAATGAAPVLDHVRVEANTGNGFYVGYARHMFTATDCSFSDNSGSGGVSRSVHAIGGHSFVRCQFVGNGVSGYRSGAYCSFPTQNLYVDCEFSGNVQDGYLCTNTLWQSENFSNCTFADNGGHGASVKYAVTYTDCTFADNVGWGLRFDIMASDPGGVTVETSAFERNDAGGIGCFSATTLFGNINVSDSTILDNGGAGFTGLVTRTPGIVSGCVIARNGGPGLELRPLVPPSYPSPVSGNFVVTRNTIDGNTGAGLSLRFESGHDPATDVMGVAVSRTIISGHVTAASVAGMVPGTLGVECTDVWGNTDGNWVGALAPFAGLDGNLSADPIYCGSAIPEDPWSISAASPCTGDDNPACGPIGARGVGCGTYIDWCSLAGPSVEYAAAAGVAGPVTGYVQIIGVTSLAGATPGLLAQAGWGPSGSDPAGGGWLWTPAIYYRELHGLDVFRGWFTVGASGTYAYAFRYGFAGGPWVYGDLDGSDNGYQVAQAGQLVVGTASGTPDVQPAHLRLHAAQPNPFNPSTTLRFDLPTAGFTRLAVYDLAGRLVRTLVSGPMEAAAHTVTWDGRDDSGRPVSAGAYAVRLEADGQVRSQLLALVK